MAHCTPKVCSTGRSSKSKLTPNGAFSVTGIVAITFLSLLIHWVSRNPPLDSNSCNWPDKHAALSVVGTDFRQSSTQKFQLIMLMVSVSWDKNLHNLEMTWLWTSALTSVNQLALWRDHCLATTEISMHGNLQELPILRGTCPPHLQPWLQALGRNVW